MKRKHFFTGVFLIAAFFLWTILLGIMDVQPIGPQGTMVGFAGLNQAVHMFTGVNMTLYTVTDWLGLVPLGIMFGFALLGLVPLGFVFGFALLGLGQWIRRKHILRVDRSILTLGVFYLVVMAVYVFFECYVVNYRPVLIEGKLEASYPSSTTILVLCVMPTVIMQLGTRIRSRIIRRWVSVAMMLFATFMVIGRLLSGVHWFSDIVGGILLSAGLVMLYDSVRGTEFRL